MYFKKPQNTYFLGKIYWQLNHGNIEIPFMSKPFQLGSFCLKECVQGKAYQDWRKKKEKEKDSNVPVIIFSNYLFESIILFLIYQNIFPNILS